MHFHKIMKSTTDSPDLQLNSTSYSHNIPTLCLILTGFLAIFKTSTKIFSRWRPDQRLLETGELDRAEDEKKRIESIQRQAAAKRNEAGLKYEPRFFVQEGETYKTRKNYWEERDRREYWTNVVPLW